MVVWLMFLAAVSAIGGLLFLSQATAGVGMIAFGCFLGILGRVAQSHSQHFQLTDRSPKKPTEYAAPALPIGPTA